MTPAIPRIGLLMIVLSTGWPTLASAADEPVRSLAVFPDRFTLRGGDDARQLLVTATLADGRLHDLSSDAAYEIADAAIVSVTPNGRVRPLADGTTTITVRHAGHSVAIPVEVTQFGESLPINFPNQVVPIFTKLGCNAGGCHGKQTGQNGFKLSLLGFDPEADYASLVKESRGRRLFQSAPEQSLLLRKPTGTIAHGGGRKLEPGSDEYAVVRGWIAAGAPYGRPADPVVTRIDVVPAQRTLSRQNRQQLVVLAQYSDGRVEDVTRRAQYESNDFGISTVDASGVVRTLGLSGQAGIMTRYQGHVATFRATVPLGVPVPEYDLSVKTIADRFTLRQWRTLGLKPSEPCTDEEFIRRASLDICGSLPTPGEVGAFVAESGPDKRDRLIDSLLDRPEYGYHFANKWADVLRVRRRREDGRAQGTFAFHEWIRSALASDLPFDRFVRELLTATGDEARNPPVVWYKEVQTPEQFADDVAQVFLGQRVACAQCHHHPYERWGQDDYWGLAAFFGRVGRKALPPPGLNVQRPPQLIFTKSSGTVTNKRTNRAAPPQPLGGGPLKIGTDDDPRQSLADWLTAPDNPYFARAIVNRYWAHFFGRGIVDPPDDMRVTNPPSNPELLDALAAGFVANHFSLKWLVRTICQSHTYGLSAMPNEWNRHDRQNFARYFPKRMTAEVLLDAVSQVTDSPTAFAALPRDRHAPRRALMLPDEAFPSYFLDIFGRPQRLSACECERVSEANLAQTLHLLMSDEVQTKLSRPGGRAEALAADPRPVAEKVEELFLRALARKPTADELAAAEVVIKKRGKNAKQAYEDIVWALLQTKEFAFIR
jgi:hypothetical protein